MWQIILLAIILVIFAVLDKLKIVPAWQWLATKLEGAKASFATSAGVGTAGAFFNDWREWVLWGIAVAIGLLRLFYEYLRIRRELREERAE